MAESLTLGGEQIQRRAEISARVLAQAEVRMDRAEIMSKQQFTRPFMWSIVAMGAGVMLFSLYRLQWTQLDLKFLLLALMVVMPDAV